MTTGAPQKWSDAQLSHNRIASLMPPLPVQYLAFIALSLALVIYQAWTRRKSSIADLPGPKPESLLLGSVREHQHDEVGAAELKWRAQYGDVYRVKGVLGTYRLFVSDPKAIRHIHHSGYIIRKQPFRIELSRLLVGAGLSTVDGENHRRHRRINSPAFGTNHALGLLQKLSKVWQEKLKAEDSIVVDTPQYFSKFLLDVIGEVAFDYRFGASDGDTAGFSAALSGILPQIHAVPSDMQLFIFGLMEILPAKLMQLYMRHAPTAGLRNSRRVHNIITNVARRLVSEKTADLAAGKAKRDILSLLVKANASENPRTSLSEHEMLSQMHTMMQAGHETTANTLSWTIFELSQRQDVQNKLRAEIHEMERVMRARGQTEYTWTEFDAMPYTIAVMKETLRYHPVAFNNVREAVCDQVLPLSKPIVTKSGETLTELPIAKDQIIVVSVAAYNRNEDVFGSDASVFNPERWLDDTVRTDVQLGPYANLMTFGSGHRACIGYRFAVYEYQTFLVELVKNFRFSMDPEVVKRVRRNPTGVLMLPILSGERTSRLPVHITSVDESATT
uniref:Cytochrome P450 n=1 Tax=Mycena chlorophos TaxID=658473 RepID=A0ABQ0L6S0_MYCCL|nr:cytochrome P450 [Mycena chlorophos]